MSEERISIAVKKDIHSRLILRARAEGKSLQFLAEQCFTFSMAHMAIDGKPKQPRKAAQQIVSK